MAHKSWQFLCHQRFSEIHGVMFIHRFQIHFFMFMRRVPTIPPQKRCFLWTKPMIIAAWVVPVLCGTAWLAFSQVAEKKMGTGANPRCAARLQWIMVLVNDWFMKLWLTKQPTLKHWLVRVKQRLVKYFWWSKLDSWGLTMITHVGERLQWQINYWWQWSVMGYRSYVWSQLGADDGWLMGSCDHG